MASEEHRTENPAAFELMHVGGLLLQARTHLQQARCLLRERVSPTSNNYENLQRALVQCDLLDMGWSHIEEYVQGLNGNNERRRKIKSVFFWVRALAEGSHPVDKCGEKLISAVASLKWRRQVRWNSQAPPTEILIGAFQTLGVGPAEILERKPNDYSSTFPSEVLTLRLPDGALRRLLVKYESDCFRNVGGHRGGPSYEADVYRQILTPLDLPRPEFVGAHCAEDGSIWLFVEFIDGSARPDDVEEPVRALGQASRWIAQFHKSVRPAPCLNRYDAAYYRQWARRAAEYSVHWQTRYPWILPLCNCAEDLLARLTLAPDSVIHGEFTPHNLLVRKDEVFPVDWESAAVAAAEIDLASLTDGWPDTVADACIEEYKQVRFAGEAPDDFRERLELARLYWTLRWLGNGPGHFPTWRAMQRIEALAPLARRIGVIVP